MMSKATWFSSLAILAVVAGCAKSDAEDFSGTAAQAIAELEEADAASVRACQKQADGCRADDAVGEAICGDMAKSCEDLDKQLGQVRSEAVGCWEGVAECKGDPCEARAEGCQKLGETVGEARKPVVECGQHVQSCMLKAAEGGQQEMGNLCGELEAACGAGVAEASMDQVRTRAREIMSGEPSGSDDGTQTQTQTKAGDGSGSGDGAQTQAQAGEGEAAGDAAQTQAQAGDGSGSGDMTQTQAQAGEGEAAGDAAQTQTQAQAGEGEAAGDAAQTQTQAQAGEGEAAGDAAQTRTGEALQSQQQECLDTIARCGEQAGKAGADFGKLGQSGGACDLSSCET
jgi:hypothetical protein